ncbi:hypothetical protein WJX74_004227 [Apatococcus lobatus]|uniref:Uncharacterized protein n=1 Tax=Apatococcus lobatus TaxID=904363 RepID=A0AAW1SG06_9CHLO
MECPCRKLFGGAIESALPERFTDVSDLRPVPDNQEIFTDTDRSETLIFEIMELLPMPAKEAAETLFLDMAEQDQAISSLISSINHQEHTRFAHIPSRFQQTLLEGSMVLKAKGLMATGTQKMNVSMANIRIPEKKSEMLITLLHPSREPILADGPEHITEARSLMIPLLTKRLHAVILNCRIVTWAEELPNGVCVRQASAAPCLSSVGLMFCEALCSQQLWI